MLAYKFYLRDAMKNCFNHLGVLPERRMDPERITDESIVNWGRKYSGKDGKDEDIFFIESVLEDSEKGFFLPLSDQEENKKNNPNGDEQVGSMILLN